MIRAILILCILTVTTRDFYAQNFIWSNVCGSKSNDLNIYRHFKINNNIVGIAHASDSLIYDKSKIFPVTNQNPKTVWVFYNLSGGIEKCVGVNPNNLFINNILSLNDSTGFSCIVPNYIFGDSIKFKNHKIQHSKAIFLTQISALGNVYFKNKIQTFDTNLKLTNPSQPLINITDSNIFLLYPNLNGTKYIQIDSNISINTNGQNILLKFNKQFKFLNSYPLLNNYSINELIINSKNLLIQYKIPYLGSLILNKDTFAYKTFYNKVLAAYDFNGNLQIANRIVGDGSMSGIVNVNNSLFVWETINSSQLKDSIQLGPNKILIKSGANTIVSYQSGDSYKFYKKIIPMNGNFGLQALTAVYNKGFILVSGQIQQPTIILPDSIIINSNINDGNWFAMKLDTFGNVLWTFWNGTKNAFEQLSNGTLTDSGVILSGSFSGQTILGKDTYISKGLQDFAIFKITDNSLYRGNISPGPYCAGDSIFVPFKANGKYNDTNTFFAELSDENGNFYGSPRELGSFKSKVSGTIRGKLPLFDVVSAAKYRIRVRSNSPIVQSFMRYDSFYLKVYSKDKARPGKDTTLCYGQRVTVSAKGGTVWKWTPGTAVKDSTARITEFIANNTNRLRIAISDTSGCGLPDTAFQTITVLPKLKAISDSIKVCVNQKLYLIGQSTGGKQADVQYDWIWRNTTTTAPLFTPTVNGDTVLYLIARDQCSAPDTGIIIFKTYNAPKLITPDTLLCRNIPFTLAPKAIYDDPPQQPTYLWYTSNYLKVNNGNLISKVQSDTQFIVIVHDNCSQKRDTQTVRTTVHSLPIMTSMLDSVCAINKHKLVFLPKLGLAPYQYFVNQIKQDSITLMPANGAQKLALQIQDACNSKSNTDTLLVFEQPRFKITIDKPKGCVPFTSIVETQNSNQSLRFDWYSATSSISNNKDSIHVPIALVGKTDYKVLGYNAHCIDSIKFELEGLPKPIADFNLSKMEMSIKEKQIRVLNASQNAIQYQFTWDKYNRSFTAIDTFYLNISDTGKFKMQLVATNTHGCTDTASKYFTVYPLPKVYFPTGFTANGDGLNETFYPKGLGVKSYRLQIYNRWGEAVFKGKENEPWTPTTSIFPGAYVFRCVITGWGETPEEYKGVVVLLK